MKAVGLFICLVGSAFAIPTHPVNHKLRTHGWKTPEKTEDIHPEASKEKNTGYVDKGDLLPRHRNSRPEVSVPGTEHSDEPQTITKHGRTGGEHHAKNSLKSINFLALHNKLGLAPDNQDSDSGSSGREQSSSEHYQLSHEKHGNMANQHLMGNAGHPVGALGLDHEQNMWKYNKNTVGLSEKNSESNEEESMEEEEEEWGEETDNREMKHKGHQRKQGDRYKRQQNKNSMQSDEVLRDSSQSIQITKRHGDKFDLEEELRENSQKKSHKEEIPLSQKTHNEDQDENQQSQEMKDNIQVNYQSDHDTVIKIDNTEESNDDDGHDRGDADHEEYLSKTWKEAAYEEEERIQSNDRESTSTEHEGEGTTEDDAAAHGETKDYQNVKIKDLIHSEQDDYDHEPPNSDSKQQLKMSSSVQSINSMESEDKVKTAGSSYGEVESVNNRSEKALLDPCWNFHCKRGKVCHVDKLGKHHCICQDPAACPSTKDYEHVCGTDNKTYDGACQLFGTKCQLEGTKMGRQLHLDYMGSCKYIPPCTDYEVDQFPLRMRDWLKNILMQYYERDLNTSGILTEKQRSKDLRKLSSYKMEGLVMDNQPVKRQNKREQPGSHVEFHKLKGLVSYSFPQGTWKKKVKKIYQNEKRLGAGDHTAELLLHDFEKNYHMYVYPVHWQFHQLDQHPVDRLLIHSELAPLRASLVPMEHCITRFFQECDGDHDKLIALKEWCHCFGIKEEDINENLLF